MGPPVLASARVTVPGAAPARWVVFLHGILGTRSNWRTLARRVVDARPTWGAVLLDLRNHGASQGFAPPHAVDAAASDVRATVDALGLRADAVVGHSYGGKVALAYAAAACGDLGAVVTVDASPGPRVDAHGSEGTLAVVDALDSLPVAYTRREDFIHGLTARGLALPTAQWLAMNLQPSTADDGTQGFVLRVDTAVIRAMIADYLARDLWGVVEHPPGRMHITLVVGGRSGVYDVADRRRAAAASRASYGRVTLETIPEAGHWVHVDAPEAVRSLVVRALDGAGAGMT